MEHSWAKPGEQPECCLDNQQPQLDSSAQPVCCRMRSCTLYCTVRPHAVWHEPARCGPRGHGGSFKEWLASAGGCESNAPERRFRAARRDELETKGLGLRFQKQISASGPEAERDQIVDSPAFYAMGRRRKHRVRRQCPALTSHRSREKAAATTSLAEE